MTDMVKLKTRGWRGSEDLWLRAAYEILIESGVEAVKVMPLAKRLGLSRTSFYWHFEDRDALLAALIRWWEEKNTGNLIAQTQAYADSITEAMFNVFDCWIDPELFDAHLDFAIRNWAQNDDALKEALNKADHNRTAAIGDMYRRFGFPEDKAEVRAHTVYFTQVGYISMMVTETFTERVKRMPAYIEVFTGQEPTEAEIARFLARHKGKFDN